MNVDRHTHKMFAILDQGYTNLLHCCDRLEVLGDASSCHRTSDSFLEMRDTLISSLESVRLLEDVSLLPALKTLSLTDPAIKCILQRLNSEHLVDACYLEEVVATLGGLAIDSSCGPDHARWVFKSFVRGLRRHVATERHMIRRLLGD